jgi:hypothetical protein
MVMSKEWQTFVRKYEDMKEGKVKLFIKDLTPGPRKYDTRFVKATVSKKSFPDGDILWIRGESGLKGPEPWFIKVEEVLPEWVAGKPYENVLDAVARES